MAAIGTVQIAGNVNAGPAEVELNTLAQRQVVRPYDYTYLGTFMASGSSNIFNGNTQGAGAQVTPGTGTILAFRNQGAALIVVKKITVGYFQSSAQPPLGLQDFFLLRATAFTQSLIQANAAGVGGVQAYGSVPGSPTSVTFALTYPTQIIPARLRGDVVDSAVDISVCSKNTFAGNNAVYNFLTTSKVVDTSGAVAAGIVFISPFSEDPGIILDSFPVGTVTFAGGGAASSLASTPIFDTRLGEQHLILSQNTGFVIQFSLGSTSTAATAMTADMYFSIYWDEVSPTTFGGSPSN